MTNQEQPRNLTNDPDILDKFWWWAEQEGVDGAHRVDGNWRVDEIATKFAAYYHEAEK